MVGMDLMHSLRAAVVKCTVLANPVMNNQNECLAVLRDFLLFVPH